MTRAARLFRMAALGIRRLDAEPWRPEVSYGDVIVRHHAFPDHWGQDQLHRRLQRPPLETTSPEDNPSALAFNCDIAIRMLGRDGAVFAEDSWLDVLVRRDGGTSADDDAFDDAGRRGLLSRRKAV
jgi:hypothetical protein